MLIFCIAIRKKAKEKKSKVKHTERKKRVTTIERRVIAICINRAIVKRLKLRKDFLLLTNNYYVYKKVLSYGVNYLTFINSNENKTNMLLFNKFKFYITHYKE